MFIIKSIFLVFKGLTPLHLCIIGDNLDCIRRLIDSNASINIRTYNGSLPIHFAAYNGDIDIFDLLHNRSKASDLTETDQQGNVNKFI
jgi:ankyrin repeat protein